MLLHIVVNPAQYRGDSGRIKPKPATIRNCFLLVSYLNRRTIRNGLKFLQFSTNPAESLHLSILDDSGDSWSVWNRGNRYTGLSEWMLVTYVIGTVTACLSGCWSRI